MSSKSSKKKSFSASHQRSWIWGKHAVLETLDAGFWPIKELYLSNDLPLKQIESIMKTVQDGNTAIEQVTPERLYELCHASDHQGFLARMAPFPFKDEEAFLRGVTSPSLILILDRIQDSHNFGALIRSAEVFGADAVILGDKGQSGVNGQVVRSSAGAINRIPLVRVESLPDMIDQLIALEIACWATMPSSSIPLECVDFTCSSAIIIGNEAEGISPDVAAVCSGACMIPQSGSIQSLNAAAAGAVCLYEARRQRDVH